MATQGHGRDVVFLSGKRTGFGTFGGSLKDLSAIELGAVSARAAIEAAGIEPDQVDHTFVGNAIQTSADAHYMARHVALKAGVPEGRPALIRKYAPYLRHYHANDPNLHGPGWGEVPFEPIFEALQDIGFDRYVSVEVFNFEPGPVAIAGRSFEYMQACLERAKT